MSLDLYNANLISIFLLVLLLSLSYYSIQDLRKKKSSNLNKFFLLSRFVGILIIAILFLHPIISFSKQEKVSNTLNIYIDNSKSMGNNILIDDLKQILTNIKEWGIENNYILNYYTIGNSVRELNKNLSDLDFSERNTDLDKFRDYVINKKMSDQSLLITDGLNYLGQNQKYNFGKKINILGIGKNKNSDFLSIEKAYSYKEEDVKTIKFHVKNTKSDKIFIDLYQKDFFLESYSVELDDYKNGYRLGAINADFLNLENYNNLKLEFKNDIEESCSINVINSLSFFKPILLISGTPSLNTKYIKGKLMEIGTLEHSYSINDTRINTLDNLDKFELVVFENYPSSKEGFSQFKEIVEQLDNTDVPFMMIAGPNQNYDIIEKISDVFSLKISKTDISEKKLITNNYHDYNLSEFYPANISYRVESSVDHNRNIYYDDTSPAIFYIDDNSFIFYPDIAKISYKNRQYNSLGFENFINDIFSDMYYRDSKVELFTNKSQFYNNEEIEIQILNNSNFDFSESYIAALNNSNQIKWELDKDKKYLKRKIISPGNYSIQLVDKEEIVSNVLNIVVKDYLDESSLFGKDASFLTRVSRESNGKYFEESNYLEGIKNLKKSSVIINHDHKYNSKQYLFLLLLSIILLSSDWYYRKKNGLL